MTPATSNRLPAATVRTLEASAAGMVGLLDERIPVIEVVGEPKRVYSNFIKGYETLPVRIPG